jgi:ribosomal protein S18 acetylase RimI-like enzyme
MKISIGFSKSAFDTPAFALLAESWNELVQSGLTMDNDGLPPFGVDTKVLYATSGEGDIIGLLAWAELHGTAHVSMAYVEPSSRRRGVLKDLWGNMRSRLQAAQITRVCTQTHMDNDPFKAFMHYLLAPPKALMYQLEIGTPP